MLMMCRLLKVSPSDYYDWRERPPSATAIENEALLAKIRQLHMESDGVMGAPRIRDELHYQGLRYGKNRIARLIRLHDIQGIPQRRQWRRKAPGLRPTGIDNVLNRDFKADQANAKWMTDIT